MNASTTTTTTVRSVIVYHTINPQPYAKYLRLPGDLGYIRSEGFDGPVAEALEAAFLLPGESVCNSHPI